MLPFGFFVGGTRGNGSAFEEVDDEPYDSKSDSIVDSVRTVERGGSGGKGFYTSYYLEVDVFDADYVVSTSSFCLVGPVLRAAVLPSGLVAAPIFYL